MGHRVKSVRMMRRSGAEVLEPQFMGCAEVTCPRCGGPVYHDMNTENTAKERPHYCPHCGVFVDRGYADGSYAELVMRLNKANPIQWRSQEERLACFDAIVTLLHRGVQTVEVMQVTLSIIVGRPVYSHEMATSWLPGLREEVGTWKGYP